MRFLILGLPKTGKTMLVSCLSRIEGFHVLGEVFNTRGPNPQMPKHPQTVIQDMRGIDLLNNIHTWYHRYYGISYIHDITDYLTDEDIDKFLDTIYLPDKHCAFKLHHHHIELAPYLLRWFRENQDVKIIHCDRNNKIKQALAAIGNRARGEKFYADPQSTLNLMEDNIRRFEELRKWFKNRHYYMEIQYEDMTGDTDTNILDLRKIKSFLNVEMPDSIDILTRKNTRNKISENLTNYDEFYKFFKDLKGWLD